MESLSLTSCELECFFGTRGHSKHFGVTFDVCLHPVCAALTREDSENKRSYFLEKKREDSRTPYAANPDRKRAASRAAYAANLDSKRARLRAG